MKSRPILFSDPMVRAIRAGKKTQTRRIAKPQPPTDEAVKQRSGSGYSFFTDHHLPGVFRVAGPVWAVRELGGPLELKCPYGKPGDELWVREAWSPDHKAFYPHWPIVYRADVNGLDIENGKVYSPEQKAWYPFRWRPSIHMPRTACRIHLAIEATRVERLQSITKADAIAEGCSAENRCRDPREQYADLWDTIHGAGAWEADPLVWVVTFTRKETA